MINWVLSKLKISDHQDIIKKIKRQIIAWVKLFTIHNLSDKRHVSRINTHTI